MNDLKATNRILIPVLVLLCVSLSGGRNDQRIEIYNLRSYTHPSHTRVVVDVGKLREYSFNELSRPDRIYVDIYQAKLNPILHGKTFLVQNLYLNQIRIAQKTSTTVRVVADLDFAKVKRYHVFHLFDPFRIVIDIYPKSPDSELPTEKPAQPPQPSKAGYSMVRQLGLGIKTIVIDPGHGGDDPGCIGKKGLMEKHVTLDVARRLKTLLSQKNEIDVILTRESDIFIPLENRTVIANQKQADLYVSIHANASRNKKRSGVMSFYLNFSNDPTVTEIAARENATSSKNISDMTEIIKKIIQNSKIDESQDLAVKIQDHLVKNLSQKYKNVHNLGVKGAPFWVLIGVEEVPSVLVEVSYLSNLQEESRLKKPEYRQQIAQGLYEGIIDYIHSLGKG